MQSAGGTACATNGKSFARNGGAGFSLPTPACGRIFSQLLRERLVALSWKHMRLLVVEDEKRIADFLCRGLEGAGYAVDRKSVV